MRNVSRVIESSMIYSGGIHLRKDKFSLNGKIIDKEIVGHQDSVGIVAIKGRSVILVSQYRHAANKMLLEIPAGKIEKDETPRQAAVREMAEEIGLLWHSQTVIEMVSCTRLFYGIDACICSHEPKRYNKRPSG